MDIQLITFDQIKEVWTNKLWPGRESPIKGMSSMMLLGGFDMSVYDKYRGVYYGAFINDELVGVNSGHQLSTEMYRSRGLWVNPDYRGNGIAKQLLLVLDNDARSKGCKYIWTMPRESAWPCYRSCDYHLVGDWFETETCDSNCYAIKKLKMV